MCSAGASALPGYFRIIQQFEVVRSGTPEATTIQQLLAVATASGLINDTRIFLGKYKHIVKTQNVDNFHVFGHVWWHKPPADPVYL